MYLKEITFKNFRSFASASISLQRDLTVLVGENNSGKSNAIDGIRLLTPPLSGRRDIYCQLTDIRFGSGSSFDLAADYAELTDAQQASLISASKDKKMQGAAFGLSFDQEKRGFPPRPEIWAGRPGNRPEPDSHDLIRHVYLPTLRDAKYSLASGNPTRVLALIKHFLNNTDETQLVKDLARKSEHRILNSINQSVDIGLSELTSGVREQKASLGFSRNENLIDIARDLRFSLADSGIRPEDLSFSGHGYANLLYIATIAVELENVSNADLTLFLVEEPEAHLHPQLQSAVLAFLKERSKKSRKEKNVIQTHAGELQVVVATHSPNLTAGVPCENIVFLRSIMPVEKNVEQKTEDFKTAMLEETSEVETGVEHTASHAETERSHAAFAEETNSIQAGARRESHSISLANLLLKEDGNPDRKARRKVDRYIDVTKAAFLFGGRVLLVEGIAEALLLPLFAEKFVLTGDAEALRRFRSTTFVPIEGVDFAPYVNLLTSHSNDICIAQKLIVVTDGDGPDVDQYGVTAGTNRKKKYDDLARKNGAADICFTFTNSYSLETELLLAGNEEVLRAAYLDLHPRSLEKWNAVIANSGDKLAIEMHELFKGIRKGDFAQALSEEIVCRKEFNVPKYLSDAIRELTK